MTMPDRRDLELEYLRGRVAHLEGLVDDLARIRPRSVWGGDSTELDFPGRVIGYGVRVRVPDWPLLTVKAQLAEEFWAQPFGMRVFEEFANRAHRALTKEIDGRRSDG